MISKVARNAVGQNGRMRVRKVGLSVVDLFRKTMAEETPKYQELLDFIVRNLVDNPDDVQVERRVDEMGVLLSLKVNAQDMGQIVGRQGSTARAIRTLVRIAGLKAHARVNLKIEEPEGGRGPAPRNEDSEGGRGPAPRKEESLGDLNI